MPSDGKGQSSVSGSRNLSILGSYQQGINHLKMRIQVLNFALREGKGSP
jgi:hypothetical protein